MQSFKPVRKVVFPVGGLGTRFLPATKAMPKEMLPVVDKPIIQYAFEEAQNAGIEQFVFITGRNKNIISNHFDHVYELQKVLDGEEKQHMLSLTKDWLPNAGQIAFIRQQEPLGLGHAVWCARHFIGNEPFAVILADEMLLSKKNFLKEMIETYEEKQASVIGVADIEREKTGSYGIIDPESDDGRLIKAKDMVEKPAPEKAPSTISILGRYILKPEIFWFLEKAPQGKNGEIQLTDAMREMNQTDPFYALRFMGKRFDCGNRRGFIEATIAYALEQPDLHEPVKALLKKYAAA